MTRALHGVLFALLSFAAACGHDPAPTPPQPAQPVVTTPEIDAKLAAADKVDGTEDKDIVLKLRGKDVPFKGQPYLLGFAYPNFYFHITTAYNILRHNGVEIGKRDFLGG